MAGLIPLGTVAKPGEDIFPTTGPHLDVRVKKKGEYIDPMTARSILQNVLVGKDKTPLFKQEGEEFKPSYTITSPYGQRTAPTAGASTFHRGIDIGIEGGTPLTYKGYGKFKPGEGLGTLETNVAGVPYTLEFLHTKPGQQAEVLGQQQQQLTQTAQPTKATASAPQDINLFITLPKKQSKTKEQDFLGGYISQALSTPTRSTGLKLDPIALLMQATSGSTNYFS
jgi:hypothetical protein